jgi:hypothetical protein
MKLIGFRPDEESEPTACGTLKMSSVFVVPSRALHVPLFLMSWVT